MGKRQAGQTIGDRVRLMRKARGLTQVQLARRADIGQSALSSIEIGNTLYLRGGTLLRLADALDIGVNWLESGTGDPQRPAFTTTDEAHALEVLRGLRPENREAWIRIGRALERAQGSRIASATDPHPPAPVAKKRSA